MGTRRRGGIFEIITMDHTFSSQMKAEFRVGNSNKEMVVHADGLL